MDNPEQADAGIPEGENKSQTSQEDPKDNGLRRVSSRRSVKHPPGSLALRRVPSLVLLGAEGSISDDVSDTLSDRYGCECEDRERKEHKCNLLSRSCLKPHYSLKRQMMLSFGLVSAMAIFAVMIVSVVISISAGKSVTSQSRENLQDWARAKSIVSARYLAEAFTPRIPFDLVQILYHTTRDRFVGYPDHGGYEDDSNVPFFDVTTGRNRYPLSSTSLPLDWDIQANVNNMNHLEHVQDRWLWYSKNPKLSTVSALYGMQGACDPSVTDPTAITYYPNCTEANNDLATGGIVAPSPTNEQIARKAADFNPILKSLYEYHQLVKELGMFFSNAGAGSYVMFPHYEVNGMASYTSIGCEWMKAPNPFDPSRPIASQEEINRCHSKGAQVATRAYNPLERGWCRDQALNPHKVHVSAPYLDAWSDHLWLITLGRAVYDRITNEFVACILVDIEVDHLVGVLERKTNVMSLVTLVRWDDEGTVVSSPKWNSSTAMELTSIADENLEIGLDQNSFQKMKSLVDFNSSWDPRDVREVYESAFHHSDGKLVSTYPVPPPPDSYDPDYHPEFMVILSVEDEEVFQPVYDMEEAVDKEVKGLIVFTVIFGVAGLAFIVIIIFVTAHCLTEPLQWINRVADQIVKKFGEHNDNIIECNRQNVSRFPSPMTELSDLVGEFQKMIVRFSGEGTAKVAKPKRTESKKCFNLHHGFGDLYLSRQDPGFKFNYRNSPSSPAKKDSSAVVGIAWNCHSGPNIHTSDDKTKVTLGVGVDHVEDKQVLSSRLFWWIVALIVAPLLATTITISAVVTWKISTELPSLVSMVETEFVELEMESLSVATKMRALLASGTIEQALRDLHVLTRVSSWLLFGGVKRSTSFTDMTTAAEFCKTSLGKGTCSYYQGKPCDCDWNGHSGTECRDYTDSRYLQKQFFEGQSQDAWPNGDRNSTSFPEVDYTPNTTAWWDNATKVPGHEKGHFASGHETTYDRLRAMSALSVVQFPLYNYDTSKDKMIGTYIGFEADGMIIGYTGCNYKQADYSFWVSSDSNGAAKLRPDLCPVGKYGYDARCRGWYATGRKIWKDTGAPLHVTSPYLFASNNQTGQSSSSPLVDPNTQEHVGQTLIDFLPQSLVDSLTLSTPLTPGGFPILITARGDHFGADTVVGPGFTLGGPRKPIESVVLSHDLDCTGEDCIRFREIVQNMHAGQDGSTSFTKTQSDGSIETIHISYAPVTAKSFHPLNGSDFPSGVKEYESLIFSLALAEPEGGLLEPFRAVQGAMRAQVKASIGFLSAFIAVAMVLAIFISSRVTVSMTVPIMHLLLLIQDINRLDSSCDIFPPTGVGGCREVLATYSTFQMLNKVVRFANSAFFLGDLTKAHQVLLDALRLFKRLDNKKAIGVVYNNLGNTMLTMYRTLQTTKEPVICGMSKEEIISNGTSYFREAIKLGEEAYDKFYEEEGWSTNCLAFMQHLSTRYFNRAMFLLTSMADHKNPYEAERLGLRDLQISKDMDVEVADQFAEVGFTVKKVEHFDLMLGRIRGLLALMEIGYPEDDGWDVEELIVQTFKELKNALRNPSTDLFDDVAPAGRMQQLDVELIRYAKLNEDAHEAARIGIRLLVEDEYTWRDAELKAVEALINFLGAEGNGFPASAAAETKEKLLAYCRLLEANTMESYVQRASNAAEELSKVSPAHSSLQRTTIRPASFNSCASDDLVVGLTGKALQVRRTSVMESSRDDFTMEMF